MKTLVQNLPQQLQEAIQIGSNAKVTFSKKIYNQVFVSGLGGSGIGASIVQEYVNDKLNIPFVVNKDYFIPKSVNTDTLFIACSYSGNTEETLMAVAEAKKRKANIVCITSGGALAQFATKNKFPLILIPSGMPPRACLSYSMLQLLFVLTQNKLISNSFITEIKNGITTIQKQTKTIQKTAQKIAKIISSKQIAIYTTAGHEGLAIRFRQQLNENSKVLAWSSVIPEMTHNEIVGWKKNHEELAVIYCFAKDDFERNLRRMKVMKQVTKSYKATMVDIEIKGKSYFEKAIYFIHLTDWVSVLVADLNGADAVEVKIIDFLKATMSKK